MKISLLAEASLRSCVLSNSDPTSLTRRPISQAAQSSRMTSAASAAIYPPKISVRVP